jgi:hypothetical protein
MPAFLLTPKYCSEVNRDNFQLFLERFKQLFKAVLCEYRSEIVRSHHFTMSKSERVLANGILFSINTKTNERTSSSSRQIPRRPNCQSRYHQPLVSVPRTHQNSSITRRSIIFGGSSQTTHIRIRVVGI